MMGFALIVFFLVLWACNGIKAAQSAIMMIFFGLCIAAILQ